MATACETDILDQIGDDFLSCTICLEQFKCPKTLPCLHTFCQHCLVTLVKKTGHLNCPTCTAPCQLSNKGVSDIKTNFFIGNLIEIFQKRSDQTELKCGGCKAGKATNKCMDCQQLNCDDCVQAHGRFPAMKAHRIVSLQRLVGHDGAEPSKAEAGTERSDFCVTHPERQLTLFCDTCEMAICADCAADEHHEPGHSYQNLEDAAEECMKQLADLVEKLKSKESALRRTTNTVLKELDDTHQEDIQIVKKKVQQVIDKTRVEEKSTIEELNDEYKKKKKCAQAAVDELEMKNGDIVGTCRYLETLMHHGNGVQLLSTIKRDNIKHIKELLAKNSELILDNVDTKSCISEKFNDDCDITILFRKDVCLSQCTAVSQQDDRHVKVLVTTRDAGDRQIVSGQEVKAKLLRPDGSLVTMEILDHGDGTFMATAYKSMMGNYQVTVTVGGKEVPSSPIVIPYMKKALVKSIRLRLKGSKIIPSRIAAVNRDGDIATCCWYKGTSDIFVISKDGTLKHTFKSNGDAIHVAVSDDNVYYSIQNGYKHKQIRRSFILVVQKDDGKVIKELEDPELEHAKCMAVSPVSGNVYVSLGKENSVNVYNEDGKYLRSFGSDGTGQGEFNNPCGIAITARGMVFVADKCNHRIQVFDENDEFAYQFGLRGKFARSCDLHYPELLATDGNKHVYVSDQNNIKMFEMGGHFICQVDYHWQNFESPRDIAITNDVPYRLLIAGQYRDKHCINVLEVPDQNTATAQNYYKENQAVIFFLLLSIFSVVLMSWFWQ
ncbi:tripartite motif-containing protein 2-like [Ptychodera flava]|uniref:tripartite motif-containing protein 2-like n=1 Tax=Ptychodera flava TaxID=63121 RepID=UPI003969F032